LQEEDLCSVTMTWCDSVGQCTATVVTIIGCYVVFTAILGLLIILVLYQVLSPVISFLLSYHNV